MAAARRTTASKPARREGGRPSTLADLQRALARILMEPGQADAFAADPRAFVRAAGLRGPNATLLAGMDAEGASYFASRRTIDRRHYLLADLPRTVAALDATVGLEAYFAARPYAYEEPGREMRQALAWAKAAAKSGKLPQAVADLAAIEVGATLLMRAPYRDGDAAAPTRRAGKAGAWRPVRAQMARLRVAYDPDALLQGDLEGAARGPFDVALHREPDDVEVYRLEPRAAALLRAADGKRTADALVAHVCGSRGGPTTAAARASLKDLKRLGLLR